MINGNRPHKSSLGKISQFLFVVFCLGMICLGVYYRFSWRNWSEGANLHPDEYGLTNTLTQLSIPLTFSDYFNTRQSPISPYHRYNAMGMQNGNGPDNRMRWGQWPIILIRWVGEQTGNTGYNEIRLLGRLLSAVADSLSLLLLFLIAIRIMDWKPALLAVALSALSVLQIQQAHFMTVDTFALLFSMLTIYACVNIAQLPLVIRSASTLAVPKRLQVNAVLWRWLLVFSVGFGMAVASKINLIVLGGLLPLAVFIGVADFPLRFKKDISGLIKSVLLVLTIGFAAAFFTFRLTQPMTFRAETGDTTLLTFHLNPDWMDSMAVAQMESKGIGGGPPAEQWTHRTMILFPLMNMIFWGMGLPLGLTSWMGVITAAWLMVKQQINWRIHLVPLTYVTVFFLFMGTRWVKSMRYFLPIYPLLIMYAAWLLVILIRKAIASPAPRKRFFVWLAVSIFLLITVGTGVWASAFTKAVYVDRHTRIIATEWIYAHIPGAINFIIETPQGEVYAPLAVPNDLLINKDQAYSQSTLSPVDGKIVGLFIPRLVGLTRDNQDKILIQFLDLENQIQSIPVPIQAFVQQENIRIPIKDTGNGLDVLEGQSLSLEITNLSHEPVSLQKVVLSNESWDEGLPVRFRNWDPFSQLYIGNTMEVRWMDDANKKQMFLDRLAASDYIIIPSQRAIWASSRLPLMYPMTMTYYRSLFAGDLGFEQVAEFQAPMRIGKLQISDVGGSWAFDETPVLPVFNYNGLAAEEAFSVYDHPPVWIFKKTEDFDLSKVKTILDAVDLNQVVVQSPRNATYFEVK
jgi:hypothetical protein